MTKPAPSLLYYCAACDAKLPTREVLHAHRKSGYHRAKTTEALFKARDWVALRLVAFDPPSCIPHEQALYVDEKTDGDNAKTVHYVPRPVADAINDWHALPYKAKVAQPLHEYLRVMFKDVDWALHSAEQEKRRM